MASGAYTSGLDEIVGTSFAWPSTDVRGILVDLAEYTFSAAHVDLSSVASGARVAESGAIGNKAISGGVLSADDVAFSSVPAGDPVGAIVLFRQGVGDANRKLLFYIEFTPVTPNGGDITVKWDTGANKIVKFG